jgi:hypothetical protein
MKFLRLLLLVFASSSLAFAIEITPSTLPNGTVKTAYSADIEASGGCTPYKWAFDSGNVPAGITVRPSTTTTSLILGGAPTTAGTNSFVIRVTDCRGSVSQASYKVAIQSAANPVVVNTTALPNGTVKTAYSADIQASGGCTPYKWAFDSGNVPAGVTVRPSTATTSLILGGTPTTAGTDSFVIRVTDCRSSVSQASYKVAIQSAANHVVDLSWKPSKSPHIAGYNIYRGLNETKWEKINASLIASTLYDDSTVANGSTYYYATTAVNIEGEESAKSAAVKAIIP